MTRRAPPALVVLLLVAAVELIAWSILAPALQEPDEDTHFSYVQSIADRHEIPWTRQGPTQSGLEPFSPELRTAAIWAGLEPLEANRAARPLWTPADRAAWAAHDRALGPGARTRIGNSTAFENPPLAYLYDSVPYRLAGGSFFSRLFAARVANLPWVLVVVAATWLLAVEVFGPRSKLVALAAGVVALQPLLVSVAGGVTPDALLCAVWAVALLVCVRLVRRGLSAGRVVALVALVTVGALTHGRALALVVPALVALWLAWWRTGPPARAVRLVGVVSAVGALALLVPALRFTERGGPTVTGTRGFASYLWQFYLPRLPWMNPPPVRGYGVRQLIGDRLYGTFGHLEITLAPWVLNALAVAAVVLLVGLVAGALRNRGWVRARSSVLAVLAVAAVAEMLLLHAEAYRVLLRDPDPVISGRQLLPLLPLLALAIAAVVGALPRRFRDVAGGAVLGVAVLLQFAALAATYTRFYA